MNDRLQETQAPNTNASGADLSIKKILVAVDLSPRSEQTADYAAELAKHFGAHLTLVHVLSPKEATEVTSAKDNTFDEPTISPQEQLENLARKIRRMHPSCSAHLCLGEPANKIAQMAELLRADLILTGDNHPRFLGRLLGPDESSRIIAQAPCPVFVCHDEA